MNFVSWRLQAVLQDSAEHHRSVNVELLINTLVTLVCHMHVQVLSESLAWMGTAVEDFGLAACDVPAMISWLKADLASSNAPCTQWCHQPAGRLPQTAGPWPCSHAESRREACSDDHPGGGLRQEPPATGDLPLCLFSMDAYIVLW